MGLVVVVVFFSVSVRVCLLFSPRIRVKKDYSTLSRPGGRHKSHRSALDAPQHSSDAWTLSPKHTSCYLLYSLLSAQSAISNSARSTLAAEPALWKALAPKDSRGSTTATTTHTTRSYHHQYQGNSRQRNGQRLVDSGGRQRLRHLSSSRERARRD